MNLFAGIDEAGLGPMLGPLTLGYAVFRAPESASNLWRSLSPLVTDDPKRDRQRFVVADSKLVFKRTPRCSVRLEATALGFLALLDPGRRPHTRVGRLLWETPSELAADAQSVARHPWYRDMATPLPRHQDPLTLELRIEALWRVMEHRGVRLLDAGVRAVPEAELNTSFRATDNKARTHWHASVRVFKRIWERHASDGIDLLVDRHGGRMHYGALLAQEFLDAVVTLIDEESECSRYSMNERGGPRRMRIAFAEKAERQSFAVALASCLAKYARESAMDAFNAWFSARAPELKPTAGYLSDARRWLDDAGGVIEREGLDRACLVRER